MVETVLNKILLNIDSKPFAEKPTSEDVGAIKNRIAGLKREVTPKELFEAIQRGQSFTPAAMDGADGKSWQSQQIICADIDNDDKEHNRLPNPLRPEAAQEILKRHGIRASYIYKSFRYRDEWPKYRIVLVLEKPITDKDTAQEATRKLAGLFNSVCPMCADTRVTDPARLFFGSRKDCTISESTERTALEKLTALPDPAKVQEPQQPRTRQAPTDNPLFIARDEARQEIRRRWREIIPELARPAKKGVNHEQSYVCPMCGHGKGGDGLTFDPKSAGGETLKCFGCGFSGDIIALYMEARGVDYNEALKGCGAIIGVQIDRDRVPDRALSWNSVISERGADPGTAGQDPGEQAAPKEVERWGAIPVNGADLMDEDIPPLEWLVPDLLPAEGVSIISAPSKSYKSFLAMQICLALSRGGKFFGRQCEQRVCLYADLEGGKRREQDRLRKMGATKEDLKNLYLVPGESIGVIGQGLEEWIALQKKYIPLLKLVIIDIFMLVRPALGRYSGDAYRIDTTDIKKLSKVAKDLDIAILLVHHNNKVQKEADVFNKMSGSTGMSGAVTCAWQITKERFSDDAIISIMGNDLESKQLVAYFDKQRWTWVCRGDKETVEQARIDKEFFSDTDIAAIKKIVDSVGTWKGTYKDFCSLAENLGFRVEDGAQAAKEFSKKVDTYLTHLAAEGYLVQKTLRNRSYLYTFQRANGQQQAVDLTDFGEQEELQV